MLIALLQLVYLPDWINAAFIILPAFIVVNLIYAHFFKLVPTIKKYWTVRKIIWLPVGILFGYLLAITPLVVGLVIGKIPFSDFVFNNTATFLSFTITLAIVMWEEFWFRGILLNYCTRYLSPLHISIAIGLLFMLMHFLNPEINLLKTGLSLFFAGALLTMLYFYSKTIWLPIGVHLGNNYSTSTVSTNLEDDTFLGSDGYVSVLLLASFFVLIVFLSRKSYQNRLSQN